MANRRMFSLKIIDTDLFLDMPITARLLYYDLSMRADDDGFVASPKKIQRMIGCSDDDMKLLTAKGFIIPFNSGICVIRHWRIHNYIQKDRYTPTMYQYEKAMLENENGAYELLDTECIQDVSNSDTQVRLGKVRLELGKDNNKKKKKSSDIDILIQEYTDNEKLIETLQDFLKMRKSIKKPMTSRATDLLLKKLNNLAATDDEKIEILNQSIFNSWQGIFPLKSIEQKSQPKVAKGNFNDYEQRPFDPTLEEKLLGWDNK